jgi:trk system potassium uptake protein TrkH
MHNYFLVKKSIFYSPGRIIICALTTLTLLGAVLLWMPFSHHGQLSFVNALFTATSLTCVTGLLTVPLSSFTFTGHCILLFLMQIGGLGLVTLTIFLISLFFELGLTTRYLTGEMLELESWNASHNLLLFNGYYLFYR